MKLSLIYCAIVLIFTSFKIQEAANLKLSLSAVIVNRQPENISVMLTLTNNSADTLKYVSWNCSWQNSYSVDNDKWRIVENICFRNGCVVVQIPPHQSESKILKLEKVKGISKSKDLKFKIGFHFFPPPVKFKKPPSNLEGFPKNDFIIWSMKTL
jgi:hypothetical protein